MNGKLKPFERAALPHDHRARMVELALSSGLGIDAATSNVDRVMACGLWLNDEYQVAIDKSPPHGFGETKIWHLSIKRIDKEPIHDWRDLQAIKNALVGEEYEAIEIYPSEQRLVDTANQYHLFAFVADEHGRAPIAVPIGWTDRAVSGADEAVAFGGKQREFADYLPDRDLHPVWDQPVVVELTIGEAHMARAAVKGRAKDRERHIDRKPEYAAATAKKAKTLRSAEAKLAAAVRAARAAVEAADRAVTEARS